MPACHRFLVGAGNRARPQHLPAGAAGTRAVPPVAERQSGTVIAELQLGATCEHRGWRRCLLQQAAGECGEPGRPRSRPIVVAELKATESVTLALIHGLRTKRDAKRAEQLRFKRPSRLRALPGRGTAEWHQAGTVRVAT